MSIVIYNFTIANEIHTNHAIINAIINLLWEKHYSPPCCFIVQYSTT